MVALIPEIVMSEFTIRAQLKLLITISILAFSNPRALTLAQIHCFLGKCRVEYNERYCMSANEVTFRGLLSTDDAIIKFVSSRTTA